MRNAFQWMPGDGVRGPANAPDKCIDDNMKYQSLNERSEFRTRLVCALNNAQCAAGATRIAREFNRRRKDEPISVYAVRKWLAGEAIPTQDKLVILADWLNVPAQWLRYGEVPAEAPAIALPAGLTPVALALLDDIVRLDETSRKLVENIIALLSKHSSDASLSRENTTDKKMAHAGGGPSF